jgi:hypothetical protein
MISTGSKASFLAMSPKTDHHMKFIAGDIAAPGNYSRDIQYVTISPPRTRNVPGKAAQNLLAAIAGKLDEAFR